MNRPSLKNRINVGPHPEHPGNRRGPPSEGALALEATGGRVRGIELNSKGACCILPLVRRIIRLHIALGSISTRGLGFIRTKQSEKPSQRPDLQAGLCRHHDVPLLRRPVAANRV